MRQNMKAVAIISRGVVRVVNDVPVPVPNEYEALVRIYSCGFCNGTDFQIIDGILSKAEGMGEYPTLLGHEAAGEVVSLGVKVRNINIGDRYIRPNLHPEALSGYTLTHGNMAEYGLVVDHKAMLEDGFKKEDLPFYSSMGSMGKIPNDFDFADAGVLVSLLECMSAVENFGIQEGMDVLVYGAGPMGLGVMSFIRQKHPGFLAAVDGIQSRLARARDVARVDEAIDYTTQDVDAALAGRGFDAVIDCVGHTSVLAQGTRQLKSGGKVCAMGVLKSDDYLLDLSKLRNNTSLHMLNFPDKRFEWLDALIKSIESGAINPKDYYSHVLPMEEIENAMELVKSKQALKVILTM